MGLEANNNPVEPAEGERVVANVCVWVMYEGSADEYGLVPVDSKQSGVYRNLFKTARYTKEIKGGEAVVTIAFQIDGTTDEKEMWPAIVENHGAHVSLEMSNFRDIPPWGKGRLEGILKVGPEDPRFPTSAWGTFEQYES